MKRPSEPSDSDFRESLFRESLSPDLRALDAELSSIRIEERASFGPELKAELERVQGEIPEGVSPSRRAWIRPLLAACLGGLMIVGVAVPGARASVARLVRTVLEEAAPSVFSSPPEPRLPGIRVDEPEVLSSEGVTRTVLSPPMLDEEEDPMPTEAGAMPEVEFTFPELFHRQEAENIVASFYPRPLQQAGIGGSVRLLLWVDTLGTVDHVQMREGSGYRTLNLAAMRAAQQLRFRPATRSGTPVGTWVEFTVQFVPPRSQGPRDLDPVDDPGPGGS